MPPVECFRDMESCRATVLRELTRNADVRIMPRRKFEGSRSHGPSGAAMRHSRRGSEEGQRFVARELSAGIGCRNRDACERHFLKVQIGAHLRPGVVSTGSCPSQSQSAAPIDGHHGGRSSITLSLTSQVGRFW
jgi:hypothetical protein